MPKVTPHANQEETVALKIEVRTLKGAPKQKFPDPRKRYRELIAQRLLAMRLSKTSKNKPGNS